MAADARPAVLSHARESIPEYILERERIGLLRAVDASTKRAIWEQVLQAARTLSVHDIESADPYDDKKRFASRPMHDPAPTEGESLRTMDALKRDFQSLDPPAFTARVAVGLPRMRGSELAVLLDYACQSIARDYVRVPPFQNVHNHSLPLNHGRFVGNFLLLVHSLSLTLANDAEWDLIGILLMVAYLEANRTTHTRQDFEEWSVRKTSGYQFYFAEYLSTHVLLPLATRHPINRHLMSWERLFQRTLLWASGAMCLPFDAALRALRRDDGLRVAEQIIQFTRPDESRPYWDGTLIDPARRLSAAQERVIETRRLLADAKASADKAENDLYIEHSNVQHLAEVRGRKADVAAAAAAAATAAAAAAAAATAKEKANDEGMEQGGGGASSSSSQRAKRQRAQGRAALLYPSSAAMPRPVHW